jgi:hypothetical protein
MLSNSVNGVKSQRRAKPRLSGRCRGLTATIRTCNDEDEDKVQTTNREGGESYSGKHNPQVVGSSPTGPTKKIMFSHLL